MEYIEKNHANRLELVRDFTASAAFTEMQQTVAWGSSGSEVSPQCQSGPWQSQRGRYPFVSSQVILLDTQQTNILMSNDNPPRACLTDFGFMTIAFDFCQPMAPHMEPGGSTAMFMSPELLVPSKFGLTKSVPTPEADIYAFGLVIHQVCNHDRGYPPFTQISRSSRVNSHSLVSSRRK